MAIFHTLVLRNMACPHPGCNYEVMRHTTMGRHIFALLERGQ